jgi:hypothetical protein
MVYACRRALLNADDEERTTGPTWLAERLWAPATRDLAADILTAAASEARRIVDADPELDGHFAACLALIADFEADTRRRLRERGRLAAA